MVITDIKRAKKALFEIYIDDKLAASLDINIVAQHKLKKYQEITQKQLDNLIFKSNVFRAKQRALFLLSRRDYTKKELLKKLVLEYGEIASDQVILRMQELGFIDDKKYALKYARDLIFRKHFAKQRARFEMSKKGLESDVIEEALMQVELDPVEEIIKLIKTKFIFQIKDEKSKRRTINNLIRKGYNYGDIKTALNLIKQEEN